MLWVSGTVVGKQPGITMFFTRDCVHSQSQWKGTWACGLD